MKLFSCDHCKQPLFFENVLCLNCGYTLAVLPEPGLPLAAITPAPMPSPMPAPEPQVEQPPVSSSDSVPMGLPVHSVDSTPTAIPPTPSQLWQRIASTTQETVPRRYRMCHNNITHQACNVAVNEEDTNPLCISCRQTQLLPDLSQPENLQRWKRIESAKRRMLYTLVRLGLVGTGRADTDTKSFTPPVFSFLADQPGQAEVMTGHVGGMITLNIAEADDDERARRRLALKEPYRTLLGHLRHESGHFYWDRLIRDGNRIDAFRAVFGDESQDYGQALQAHYAKAADTSNSWQSAFVSAYAQAHPWEDWAETWAHYLHMVDLLETAAAYQTSLVIPGTGPDQQQTPDNPFEGESSDFETMIQQWIPVTLLLNSLNRSLGQNDAYPFALSDTALQKLRFVHEVILACHPATDHNRATPTN